MIEQQIQDLKDAMAQPNVPAVVMEIWQKEHDRLTKELCIKYFETLTGIDLRDPNYSKKALYKRIDTYAVSELHRACKRIIREEQRNGEDV